MEVVQKKKDSLTATLTVTIENKDYKKEYESTLEDYRKKAQFPGFRPGKAPVALIKKKYGGAILAEKINKMLNEQLNNHIRENELPVLGNPLPFETEEDVANWEKPDIFKFTFEIGLAPEFKFKFPRWAKFEYHHIKANDEMVDRQLTDLRRRYGKLGDLDQSKADSLLGGDLIELTDEGEIKEGGILSHTHISLEQLEDKETIKQLTGVKQGERVELAIDNISKGEDDKAKMLGVSKEELLNVSNKFAFSVKEIREMIPATLNKEFFDKIYPEAGVENEEDLKNRIKLDIESGFTKDSDLLFRKNFIEKFLEKSKIDLPDDFLKRWIKQVNEKPLGDEQLEKEYPEYADSLRWQLIENKIIKEYDLNIKPEEVKESARGFIAMQYAQYGLSLPSEQLENHVQHIMEKPEERNRLVENIMAEKVMKVVKEEVKVVEKEVGYEEFLELVYGSKKK